jgi:hypothetical protein
MMSEEEEETGLEGRGLRCLGMERVGRRRRLRGD